MESNQTGMNETNKRTKEKKKRMTQNERSLRELSDSIKCTDICFTGIPEEETKNGAENLCEEIKAENFPNLGKET